jgi:hypothetical protein
MSGEKVAMPIEKEKPKTLGGVWASIGATNKNYCDYDFGDRARPRQGSNNEAILAALCGGRYLTGRIAFQEFGVARLTDVIYRLRRKRYFIMARPIAVPTRGNKMTLVAEYWMPDLEALARRYYDGAKA